ncbi:MAG: outer membrane lipid asymmetry maintenance protein MlaD [Proteobacteria bacterium]|nr:outer membrane lipid asymmetry maintenance protein MlaD [Pseudomonadota bacterium]MBU1584448.1 outer membrane lipid asymmetry maintenance protein MlaD [Pseudomonadota bacterium]MBU2451929.1 outer membrane lipid asymmetry maintenance protein MlaD [Pseudomonadota bacterium]MBU2628201.1 outer membrane lipid asymmetry maintenance protein MlaD [Pseudomonadota bacterium]
MDKRKIEFYVGLFVIIGLICVVCLFAVLGEISFIKDKRYPITAFFTSVSGLKTGARVEMAGVEIGAVSTVSIDKERLLAKVELSIDKNISLSEDIIASVKTSGIIGQKFIEISPGGSDIMLEPGEEVYNTESSLDIESLVRKIIFDKDNK